MIRRAIARDSDILTTISFAAKGYWGYPTEYFAIWKDELTISPEYIRKNDVFVYENQKSVSGYYSRVILDEDIEVSGIVINKGAWLEHMFVDPPNIGKGIGTKLFDHLRQTCVAAGIPEVGILADPHSRGFYEKMGCTYIREYPSTIKDRTTPFLQYKPAK
jgi:GNAT superfamily N-acetyltransferase